MSFLIVSTLRALEPLDNAQVCKILPVVMGEYTTSTLGTMPQWCAGRVTVNKVIDRQKTRSMVNKLTVTFDQPTIIGNDLSASFGMVDNRPPNFFESST